MKSRITLGAARHVLAAVTAFILLVAILSPAQTTPSDSPYSVVDRGGFYRVLQRSFSVTNGVTGEISNQVQSYTELGDGMHYLLNGQWVESEDSIEITATGAEATRGQMAGKFNSDIFTTGAITLATATEVFRSHPVGLFYADAASGKVAQIAPIQSSIGILYPPNVLVYSNVLSGLNADLMLVWTKQGFEQNLVLKESPLPPSSFGLSNETTTIQLWSAMDNCPAPTEQRSVRLDSALEDHILIFGSCWFPVGAAFVVGGASLPPPGQPAQIRLIRPSEPGTIPVAKTLVKLAGQQVLIEEVRYIDLIPALSQLPQASVSRKPNATVELADRQVFLTPPPRSDVENPPMQVASTQYTPKGVVVDYTELSGGANSFTFSTGTTYHIASLFSVGPSLAYFEQNACIKLDTNAYCMIYGNVYCSSSGSPTVFTSRDDNSYGAAMTNSTANPGYAAAEGIWMYYQTMQTTLQNVRVRWAQKAIRYDSSAARLPQLSNASLEDCVIGIHLNILGDTLTLSQVTECNVTTPVYNSDDASSTSGTMTTNCGVVSVAMVNDPNRDSSGLDPSKNSQTECSFVVLDSTNIVAAFMNTHLSEYGLGAYGSGANPTAFTGIPSPRMTSWAVSTNAGTNFTDKGPILPISTITNGTTVLTNGASDPMHGDAGDTTMAYDSRSNVVYLLVNTSREPTNHYGPRLWSSANRGQTFSPVNMDVPGFATDGTHRAIASDKPMVKVNPDTHDVFVACSGNGRDTWAARSTNGGMSWINYQQIETTGTDSRGADIVILPDGTVYVFWLMANAPQYPITTNFIRYAWFSTNGTWSYATNIGPQLNSLNANASGRLFRYNGAGTNDYLDDNGFPRVAYANGNIYITYADLPSTNSATDHGDIFLIEAAVNRTSHWLTVASGPRKVNNDRTQTDQWNPSIAANPSGTELFIGYYSRQNDPTTNSWIMAYGAKAFITNGLGSSTFECFPISPTSFQPLFNGSEASTPPQDPWLFDPVWSQNHVCLNSNYALYDGYYSDSTFCTNSADFQSPGGYEHFCADDYTWAVADSNYFYFAWCDRSRTNGIPPYVRADADVKFAKIKF